MVILKQVPVLQFFFFLNIKFIIILPSLIPSLILFLFFFFFKFIYLFLAVLGLRFCARAFSGYGKWGPLFIAVRGPLTIAASLVAERRLSSCGSRA